MLKQRVITAAVLALIFIPVELFADQVIAALLLALALLQAYREVIRLTIKTSVLVTWLIALALTGIFWLSQYLLSPALLVQQSMVAAVLWCLIIVAMLRYHHSGSLSLNKRLGLLLITVFLLWSCIHGLLYLRAEYPAGGWLMLYLFTLVWVADIGAYFSGKAWGKRKLAPAISPGKTWEGVLGGVLLNLLWIAVAYYWSGGWGLSFGLFMLASLAAVIVSVPGDLGESILKREAGVKDSGNLLPGHGGILDRIDSVVAAAPVFVSAMYLLGSI